MDGKIIIKILSAPKKSFENWIHPNQNMTSHCHILML